MTATDVLGELKARGVAVFVEDGDLRYRAPKGTLTDDLRARAKEHRDDLRALVLARVTDWSAATAGTLLDVGRQLGATFNLVDDEVVATNAEALPPGLTAEVAQRRRGIELTLLYEQGGEAAVTEAVRAAQQGLEEEVSANGMEIVVEEEASAAR